MLTEGTLGNQRRKKILSSVFLWKLTKIWHRGSEWVRTNISLYLGLINFSWAVLCTAQFGPSSQYWLGRWLKQLYVSSRVRFSSCKQSKIQSSILLILCLLLLLSSVCLFSLHHPQSWIRFSPLTFTLRVVKFSVSSVLDWHQPGQSFFRKFFSIISILIKITTFGRILLFKSHFQVYFIVFCNPSC